MKSAKLISLHVRTNGDKGLVGGEKRQNYFKIDISVRISMKSESY